MVYEWSVSNPAGIVAPEKKLLYPDASDITVPEATGTWEEAI